MSIDAITPVVPPPVAVAEDQPQSTGTEASTTTNTAVVPDPAELALENLSVNELKAELTDASAKYQGAAEKEMAPLLYHLRKKLNAQGKSGNGFGAWVEDNLIISRRTADRWADAHAVSRGLKKPPKSKKATFRQVSKSPVTNSDSKGTVSLQFTLAEDEEEEFWAAMKYSETRRRELSGMRLSVQHAI